jgi:hypothetical protein
MKPVARQYQSMFADGHFTLTPQTLQDLDINIKTLDFYDHRMQEWFAIGVGHSWSISSLPTRLSMPFILLRDSDLTDNVEGLDDILASARNTNGTAPSLATSIAEQRKLLKKRKEELTIAAAAATRFNHSASLSSRPHSIKREHSDDENQATHLSISKRRRTSVEPTTPTHLSASKRRRTSFESTTPTPIRYTFEPITSLPAIIEIPDSPPPTSSRTMPRIKMEPDADENSVIDLVSPSPSPPPSPLHTRSRSLSSSLPPSSLCFEFDAAGNTSDSDGEVEPIPRVWPQDYHVCDVAAYFIACDEAKRTKGGQSRENLWRQFFPEASGTRFPQQQSDRHRARWLAAPSSLQRRFLNAGRVPIALWSAFMKEQPNPNGRRDAAQKQLHRVDKKRRVLLKKGRVSDDEDDDS